MAKLGFLGLGLMGYPMARNLLDAGHEVALWSHTAAKARRLAKSHKGVFCKTPKEVGKFADCIFLCVGNSEMSEEVLLGVDGVFKGVRKGKVIADCSTIAPSVARRIAKKFETKGAFFLDAPCTGSTPGAEGGTLTFMIGGRKKVFQSVRENFLPMGKTLFYCGRQGMGLHAKLSQNLVLCNMMQGFIEGMVLAKKAGVDPKLMFEVLDKSAAKAGLISFKAPYIFKRDFEAAFPLKWMHKDIGLMLDSGHELHVPLPSTSLVHQLFGASIARGQGDEDFCSAVKLLEDWAGVEVKG
ncbi:MAG: 3-hydroxyisobutyrate dehydrogenase [Solibacterales bacterium]|nr:3-hydroxyisobutyrate dehydrogenase [Bryobacterales bacterium]|tara:strand:- start:52758 stop:53648 length:891 start_codon:yes stop_codon:yes gene_type:complete